MDVISIVNPARHLIELSIKLIYAVVKKGKSKRGLAKMGLKPQLEDKTQTVPIRNAVTGRKPVDHHQIIRNMSVPAVTTTDKPIANSVTRKHGK